MNFIPKTSALYAFGIKIGCLPQDPGFTTLCREVKDLAPLALPSDRTACFPEHLEFSLAENSE